MTVAQRKISVSSPFVNSGYPLGYLYLTVARPNKYQSLQLGLLCVPLSRPVNKTSVVVQVKVLLESKADATLSTDCRPLRCVAAVSLFDNPTK